MKCCKNCKWYLYEDTREYQEGKPKDIFCCRNIKTDYYSYPRSFDFSCDDWEAYKVRGCRLRLCPYEWLEEVRNERDKP